MLFQLRPRGEVITLSQFPLCNPIASTLPLLNLNLELHRSLPSVRSWSGIVSSYTSLGILLSQGLGVKKDIDFAIVCFEKAAALGNPGAAFELGPSPRLLATGPKTETLLPHARTCTTPNLNRGLRFSSNL